MGESKQTAIIPGEILELSKNDYWITPPWLLKRLNEEFNFNFDAAPHPRPAGFDALREEWGSRTWLNPPIGRGHSLSAWIKKAIEEYEKGKTVVMILPFPRWMRYLVDAGAEFRFPGVVRFLNPDGEEAPSEGGGHYPDILVILCPVAEEE